MNSDTNEEKLQNNSDSDDFQLQIKTFLQSLWEVDRALEQLRDENEAFS